MKCWICKLIKKAVGVYDDNDLSDEWLVDMIKDILTGRVTELKEIRRE